MLPVNRCKHEKLILFKHVLTLSVIFRWNMSVKLKFDFDLLWIKLVYDTESTSDVQTS